MNSLEKYEKYCADNKIKLTGIRREVLKQITEHAPIKAYKIIAALKKNHAKKISPPLVYRALDVLLKKGVVHKLEKLRAFIICDHPGAVHNQCAIFYCTQCHRIQEICSHDFRHFIQKSQTSHDIQIEKSTVELYGKCARCLPATTTS
ncbi:zinc uptake regulation protein [Spirochaetota bacterium]|nr:zinc uptake regulation protein [Spirochaetota bacterium]